MRLLYFDINNSYIDASVRNGTSANPFDVIDCYNLICGFTVSGIKLNEYDQDIFRFRGSCSGTIAKYLFSDVKDNIIVFSWDDRVPWYIGTGLSHRCDGGLIIRITNTSASKSIIFRDGIFDNISTFYQSNELSSSYNYIFNNCLIQGLWIYNSCSPSVHNYNFYGCSFVNYNDLSGKRDIIIEKGTYNDLNFNFRYCFFQDINFEGNLTSANFYNGNYFNTTSSDTLSALSGSIYLGDSVFGFNYKTVYPSVSAFNISLINYKDYEIGRYWTNSYGGYNLDEGWLNYPRKGIGAFNFSASEQFYFNINNSYSATSGNGTSANPFNVINLKTLVSGGSFNNLLLFDGDVLRLSGECSGSLANNLFNPINVLPSTSKRSLTITSWDDREPWKISGTDYILLNDYYDNVTFIDGIFKNIKVLSDAWSYYLTFKNCVFYNLMLNNVPYVYNYDRIYKFYGCSFIGDYSVNNLLLYTLLSPLSASNADIYMEDCFLYNTTVSGIAKNFVFGGNNYTNLSFENMFSAFSASYAPGGVGLSGLSNVIFSYPIAYNYPSYNLFSKQEVDYLKYELPIVSEVRWLNTGINEGWYNYTRNGYGAFLFSGLYNKGHIGSFYFGPIYESISADTLTLSVSALVPSVTLIEHISASIKSEILTVLVFPLIPNVYTSSQIIVDFIGVPRLGVSPLTVDFTAIVKLGGTYFNKYKVKEYKWYFDYDNYPDVYEVTTKPKITHVYVGYNNKRYTVKLSCTIVPI